MTYFTKTAYWRTLFLNDQSVDNKTNPHFKNLRTPCVA